MRALLGPRAQAVIFGRQPGSSQHLTAPGIVRGKSTDKNSDCPAELHPATGGLLGATAGLLRGRRIAVFQGERTKPWRSGDFDPIVFWRRVRRSLLGTWILGICAVISAAPRGSRGDESPTSSSPSSLEPVKRILVYEDSRNPAVPPLRWFLYDPLILSQTRIVVDNRPLLGPAGRPGAEISARATGPYDLVIVAIPLKLGQRACLDLLKHLDRGGALLLVQPSFDAPDLAAALEQRTGIAVRGYEKPTPAFSVTMLIRADKIGWRGLDGTVLPVVPRYEGLERLEQFARPDLIAQADTLGYRNVLLGWTVDAMFDYPIEQPHTLLDGMAPVSGRWVTLGEYFQSTPPAQSTRFLGVDELNASKLEWWTDWGCMNEAYAWNRDTENLLLAAERFHAVACGKRLVPATTQAKMQNALGEAWKSLLATQDHMMFGPVDYSRQVPPARSEPAKEEPAWHAWGYRFGSFSRAVFKAAGIESYGMENYSEDNTPNYGGPRIPTTRYEKVQQCHRLSRTHAQGVLDDALGRLVGSGGPSRDPQARAVCVFNPLATARHDMVTIEAALPPRRAHAVQLRDSNGPVEFQTIASDVHADGSLKLLASADVPALGYKAYVLTSAAPAAGVDVPNTLVATATKLECPYYVVELDGKHGGVARIFDKQLNREVLPAGDVPGNELWSPENPRQFHTLRGPGAGGRDGAAAGHRRGVIHHRPTAVRVRDQPVPRRQTH